MGKVLQTAGMVGKTIAKWIPPVNFEEYGTRGMFEDREKGRSETFITLKGFGHLIYALVGSMTLAYCGWMFYETGEVNPIKARQVIAQRAEQAEQERANYQKRVSELSDRVFSRYGLADTNKDGRVEFSEIVEAYRRMSLEDQIQIQLPKPNLEQLEKAVQSYQGRK